MSAYFLSSEQARDDFCKVKIIIIVIIKGFHIKDCDFYVHVSTFQKIHSKYFLRNQPLQSH